MTRCKSERSAREHQRCKGEDWVGHTNPRECTRYTDATSPPRDRGAGAPAMFFWGVGTSTIGQTSPLGWSPSLSATMMAAATICIPAIDSFLYSSSAVTWCDKASKGVIHSCTHKRFLFLNAGAESGGGAGDGVNTALRLRDYLHSYYSTGEE